MYEDAETLALKRLELDIPNGGFLQFFCNWGDKNFHDAISGLENIGAKQLRDLLLQSYAVIEKYQNDSRIVGLWDLPKTLSQEESQLIQQLDQKLCESLENRNANSKT